MMISISGYLTSALFNILRAIEHSETVKISGIINAIASNQYYENEL